MKRRKPRTIIDPAWIEQHYEEIAEEIDYQNYESLYYIGQNSVNAEHIFPERYGYGLGDMGAWIFVLHPPHTEYTVPKFSVWYAVERLSGTTYTKYKLPLKMAEITTPSGPLRLYPGEYKLCQVKDFMSFIGTDYRLCMLSGKPGELSEKIFYIRSRGISTGGAYQILLTEMNDPYLCFLTPHPACVDMFSRSSKEVSFALEWWEAAANQTNSVL